MDIKVIESGNGGDLRKRGNDLFVVHGFDNMIYLALFGGNVEESTPIRREPNKQYFDWWGNTLLSRDNPSRQYNSITEKTLNSVALNSEGRVRIENAIKADLDFMTEFVNLTVNVSIVGTDKVKIGIEAVKPENQQSKKYEYLWNLSLDGGTLVSVDGDFGTFDETFDAIFD